MEADYLKDPEAIYDRSFACIRAEADLARFPPPLEPVVVRIIHACGMTDITRDIRFSPGVAEAAAQALAAGAPILADCNAVASALTRRFLPAGNDVVCLLDDPRTRDVARARATTRSAAAVALWAPRLEGAVALIGNAPTALFALLDLLRAGGAKPAAILAFPVGFVGAAESKAALVRASAGVPYLTLLGRRGGSAMAAAALNAIALGTRP